MAKIKFVPSQSDRVAATASIMVDELPGIEINAVSIIKDKKDEGKLSVALTPAFARSTGLVPASVTVTYAGTDEIAGSVPSPAGKAACKDLADRILNLFGQYGADGQEYGL